VCLNNLKQIGSAYQTYVEDHRGALPAKYYYWKCHETNSNPCATWMGSNLGCSPGPFAATIPPQRADRGHDSVWYCPSSPYLSIPYDPTWKNPGMRLRPDWYIYSTYAISDRLQCKTADTTRTGVYNYNEFFSGYTGWHPGNTVNRIGSIRTAPSRVANLSDAHLYAYQPLPYNGLVANTAGNCTNEVRTTSNRPRGPWAPRAGTPYLTNTEYGCWHTARASVHFLDQHAVCLSYERMSDEWSAADTGVVGPFGYDR